MTELTVAERIALRGRAVTLAGLAVLSLLAWLTLLSGGGMEPMSGMAMPMSPSFPLVVAMWWVMMIAMMLPSAASMLLLFARVNRKDKKAGAALAPTAMFAAGYVLAWGGFSAVATTLQWGLESARLLSPMLVTTSHWLGAGILVSAGLWQLTPLKAVCLRHCRTPLGFLIGRWRSGRLGALRMGLEHGAYCLGCCWFLMALLFFGGVMNLYWIVGLAVFVLLEKTIPHGHWLGSVAGVALVSWGFVLAMQVLAGSHWAN